MKFILLRVIELIFSVTDSNSDLTLESSVDTGVKSQLFGTLREGLRSDWEDCERNDEPDEYPKGQNIKIRLICYVSEAIKPVKQMLDIWQVDVKG